MVSRPAITELVQRHYEKLRPGNVQWYEIHSEITLPSYIASIDGMLAKVTLNDGLEEEEFHAGIKSINLYFGLRDRERALRIFSRIHEGHYPGHEVALETKTPERGIERFELEKIEPFSPPYVSEKREKPSCYKGPLPRVRKAIDALEIAEGNLFILGIPFQEALSLKLGKEYPHFYQITDAVRGELGKILVYCRVVDEALE